jgi:hypothetical protein
MALQRPLKEGSVRTYQEKVGLGFTDILASEADGDSDTIYAAWNGTLGGDLTGTLPNPVVTAGAITAAKLAVGATVRQVVTVGMPLNKGVNQQTWTDITTVSITTSGGKILLLATGGWWTFPPLGAATTVYLGWGRDAVTPNVIQCEFAVSGPGSGNMAFPLPSLMAIDTGAVAGAHVYHLVGFTTLSTTGIQTSNVVPGGCWAVEFG